MNIDREYLEKNIKMLDGWSISVNNLTNKLSKEFLGNIDNNIKIDLENKIKDILTDYKNDKTGSITFDDVYNSLTSLSTKPVEVKNIDPTPKYTPINYDKYNEDKKIEDIMSTDAREEANKQTNLDESSFYSDYIDEENNNQDSDSVHNITIDYDFTYNEEEHKDEPAIRLEPDENGRYAYVDTSAKSESNGDIVEVDTDATGEAANSSSKLGNSIASAKLVIPGILAPFCGSLESAAANTKNIIEESFNTLYSMLKLACSVIEGIDNAIEQLTQTIFDFNSVWNKNTDNMELYNLKPADAEFFKKYHKDDPSFNIDEDTGIVTYKDLDGNNYQYDLNSRDFTINDSIINDVGIYIPNDNDDYEHMNVFTHFVGDSWDNTVNNKSNSIVITIKKSTVTQSRYPNDPDPPFVKQVEVPFITKFANATAKTDRTSCQNIIAGDSAFGAHSLGLTGSNPDLYDTVYCINNCVIVTGINNDGENKVQITEEQLNGLDGKNIYMLNLSGDGNLDHNQSWKKCKPAQSCAIEGLELIADRCKNAKIYALYGGATYRQNTSNLYQKIADEHPDNFIYMGKEDFLTFTNGHNYNTHTDGNRVMSPLISMPLTNYNAYTAKNLDTSKTA